MGLQAYSTGAMLTAGEWDAAALAAAWWVGSQWTTCCLQLRVGVVEEIEVVLCGLCASGWGVVVVVVGEQYGVVHQTFALGIVVAWDASAVRFFRGRRSWAARVDLRDAAGPLHDERRMRPRSCSRPTERR